MFHVRSLLLASLILPAVALAAESPLLTITSATLGGSVPQGAQRVSMLTLTLKNSCAGPVAVTGITVKHQGLGNTEDIERVYLTSGVRRLTRGSSSFTDSLITLRPRTLTLAACETKTVTITADFAATAAAQGEHILSVQSVETADDVPVQISASTNRKPVTAKASEGEGTVTVEMLPLLRSVTYGAGRSVARLRLTGDRRVDQHIASITLTNNGSAQGTDLQNLRLVRSNGEAISVTLPSMDGELAAFELPAPLLLERNQTLLLELRADVRASRRRTIQFIIEEPSDIQAQRARR